MAYISCNRACILRGVATRAHHGTEMKRLFKNCNDEDVLEVASSNSRTDLLLFLFLYCRSEWFVLPLIYSHCSVLLVWFWECITPKPDLCVIYESFIWSRVWLMPLLMLMLIMILSLWRCVRNVMDAWFVNPNCTDHLNTVVVALCVSWKRLLLKSL